MADWLKWGAPASTGVSRFYPGAFRGGAASGLLAPSQTGRRLPIRAFPARSVSLTELSYIPFNQPTNLVKEQSNCITVQLRKTLEFRVDLIEFRGAGL